MAFRAPSFSKSPLELFNEQMKRQAPGFVDSARPAKIRKALRGLPEDQREMVRIFAAFNDSVYNVLMERGPWKDRVDRLVKECVEGTYADSTHIAPGELVPHAYQQKAYDLFRTMPPHQPHNPEFPKGFCASWDTGCGKTDGGMMSYLARWELDHTLRCIVICPVSVMSNWDSARCSFQKRYGKRFPIEMVTIMSHVSFINKYKNPENRFEGFLIVDEAHEYRTEIPPTRLYFTYEQNEVVKGFGGPNDHRALEYMKEQGLVGRVKRSRAKIMLDICRVASYVLLLTATAFYNNKYDLMNLISMIRGITCGWKKVEWDYEIETGRAYRKAFFVVSRDDTPDYPREKHHTVQVMMKDRHLSEYLDVEAEQSRTYMNPKVFLAGMRQASVRVDDSQSDTIPWLVNHVRTCIEQNKKVLICAEFVSNMIRVAESAIREVFPRLGISMIVGTMSAEERCANIEAFNMLDGGSKVCFISSAGGTGINFNRSGATEIVVMTATWNSKKREQWVGRLLRYRALNHLPAEQRVINIWNIISIKPSNITMYAAKLSNTTCPKERAWCSNILQRWDPKIPLSADQMVKNICDAKDIEYKKTWKLVKAQSI